MLRPNWLRPPRHLFVLLLGTTLAFLAGLGWMGWSSLESDLARANEDAREDLNNAADSVANKIRREVVDIEVKLELFSALPSDKLAEEISSYVARLGDDPLIVVFHSESVQAFPQRRLLYYPVLPAADELYVQASMTGRAIPRPNDDKTAILFAREMVSSTDKRVRYEGLLKLAALEVKNGRPEAALEAYGQLRDPAVLVDGRPAELNARFLRCDLLKTLGKHAEVLEEAGRIDRDLHLPRWQLTSSTYQYYEGQIRRHLGEIASGTDHSKRTAQSIAAGVNSLWDEWRRERGPAETFEGRETQVFNDRPVFLAWRGTSERAVAFLAGPEFLRERILAPLGPGLLDTRRANVVLLDREGHTVAAHGEPAPGELEKVQQTMTETDLPWNLEVVGPLADLSESAARQQFLIAAIVCLALIVVAGAYFSARAMTREVEAARLQSEFVAAVSHEFRTPLTLLRQFSDMLADGRVSNDEERGMYYAALQRGTRRLTRLVEDLLDFARMEAGSRAFHLEPMPAREWLTRLVAEFNQEIRSKGYHAELAWTGQLAVVRADEAAIGRAVWNLLDNAVKYSPISKTIWVEGAFEKGSLTIGVRDRGLGVPPAERRAIFRKFVRGSSTNGHVVKGTGLGLALVKQIAEAHGGTVHLQSVVGEGSTFSLCLPAQAAETEQGEWLTS